MNKWIAVSALVLCAALSVAQQGQRGQRGQMGRGQMMGEAQLVMRKDVQKDLGLTSDQVTKLEAWSEQQRGQRGQGGQGGGQRQGGGGGGQRQGGGGFGGGQMTDEQRKQMEERAKERREATKKELLTVISEAQYSRLGEIRLQMQGNMAMMDAEVQKALGLSEEQVGKLRILQQKQGEATRALFEKVQNGELSREDMTASMTKNQDIMKAEIGKVLTAEQTSKFKAMQGKPFTREDEQN